MGVVAAVWGSLGEEDKRFEFILEEEETNKQYLVTERETVDPGANAFFPHKKLLRLKLFNNESDGWQEIISFFDSVLLDIVKEDHIERWVRCMLCKDLGVKNKFAAGNDFQPDMFDKCSGRKHDWIKHGWPIQSLKSQASTAC